ncbi:MAG: ATP-binding protein [Desulfococcus multivorans]|jgi:signal transduction histidine kinase|uniref:sensor histidine kinase n=1 Tax=Desulfococcus sp. TaxID=2025834 RepID=UPI002A47FCF5|nr:ATP-binding protein [Desulfococcus multivorans]
MKRLAQAADDGLTLKSPRMLPVWRVSLMLFGLLIAVVLGYFYWQVRHLQQTFMMHSLEHSRLLANVIEQNARTAVLSQGAIEKIVHIFLGNSARFVAYLEAVEPFSSDELAEFAYESGLIGIRVIRADDTEVQGPEDAALPAVINCALGTGELAHFPEQNIYAATVPLINGKGCVVTGLESAAIGRINEEIGLNRLLGSLTGMAGIRYVRVEENTGRDPAAVASGRASPDDHPHIRLIRDGGETIAESRIPFGNDILVAGMDTSHFMARTQQIWLEFFFFAGVLAMLGISFSWILNWFQGRYTAHIQAVDREMADHREDAALGRAAAAIAHEIRNPLNAIGMGLQRLRIEAPGLDDEYRDLVGTLLQAVQRTNAIVSDVGKYARPPAPSFETVVPAALVGEILQLYRRKSTGQSVEIIQDLAFAGEIKADPQLTAQMVENLVKNAVEAQPLGGYLKVALSRKDGHAVFTFENPGFDLAPSDAARIAAPYFTTKARGTGLGLSIVRKIVNAHHGHMAFAVPEPGVLRVTVRLPLDPRNAETDA